MTHEHEHEHEHDPRAIRTEALERLLVDQGLITSAAIDTIIERYETDVGPLNGARVVAKAWTDPEYRARLPRRRHHGNR